MKRYSRENKKKSPYILYTDFLALISRDLRIFHLFNQILVNRLRCKINESEQNRKRLWSVLVDERISEYSNTVHTVTKFSLNYLPNNTKLSLLLEHNLDLKSNLEDRKKALDNSQKSNESNKKI